MSAPTKQFRYFLEFNGKDTGHRFYTKAEAKAHKKTIVESIQYAFIITKIEYLKK